MSSIGENDPFVLSDAVLEEFDYAVETGVDLLASVVLFLGISSDSYAPGNLVPSIDGNLDVGVDLKLDSPAFFALGDEDVCPDRDIPFLCLSGSDKNLIVAIKTVAFKPPGSQNCQEGGYTNALLR